MMKRILYGLLATMILFVQLFALPAYAETILKDGIEVQLLTDKESYQLLEAADARLLVTNTNNFAIENVRMSIQAPEGYVLLEEANRAQKAVKLDAGDSKAQQGSVINSEVAPLPRTGDDSHGMVWFALFFVSSTALLVLVVKHPQGKRLLSLLLCVALLSSLVPAPGIAKAETVEKTITVTKEVLVNGEVVVLTGVVTYDAFVEASDPALGAPTIVDEKINNLTEQLQVETGDTLSFTGMISAPEGATISSIQVFIYNAMTEEPYTSGEKYYAISDLNAQQFDLSDIPQMTIGTPFGESNYVLEEGGLYCVMFYATDSNGNSFEDMDETVEGDQGPVIRISVKADPEDCEHPHAGFSYVRHSSGRIRKHSYDNPETHQVEPLYERYCGLCGLYLMDIWGQGTTEDHTFVNGVCSGCGYNAGDVTAPVIEPISCSTDGVFIAGTEATFSAAALDDVALAKIELYIDDELKYTETPTGEFGTISFTTSSLSIGAHTVKVVAIDESGWSREVSTSVMVLQADPATCTHVNTAVVQEQKYMPVDDTYHQLVLESRTHCADCGMDVNISAEPIAEMVEHDAWNEGVCETCGHSLIPSAFNNVIAVRMVSDKALINADVEFEVRIDGAELCELAFYDENGENDYWSDIELVNGVGTFSAWAPKACTEKFEISCEIDGQVFSQEFSVTYEQLGEIETEPQMELNAPVVGTEYPIAWDAVDGAEWYSLSVTNPYGETWTESGEERSYTVPASFICATGEYKVVLEATCAGYESSYARKTVVVSESAPADARVSVTISAQQANFGGVVTVKAFAEDATKVELYYNGREDKEAEGKTFEEIWHVWEDFTLSARALIDGEWTGLSAPVTLDVIMPEVDLPDIVEAGRPLTLTLSHAENAYGRCRIDNSETIWSEDGKFEIPGALLSAGEHTLELVIYPDESMEEYWARAERTYTFTAVGEQADAPQVTASSTQVLYQEDVEFSVTAPGATMLVIKRTDHTAQEIEPEGDTTIITKSFYDEGKCTVSFAALIDGVWSKYSEPIEITVTKLGTLDAPVITAMSSDISAGDDLNVSWNAVDHAEEYILNLYISNGEDDYDYVTGEYVDAPATSATIEGRHILAGNYKLGLRARTKGWAYEETERLFTVKPGDKLFTYSISSDEVTITGYVGSDNAVEIPAELDGYPVTGIGNSAFAGRSITSVTLPSSLKRIDYYAFEDCTLLEKLTIAPNVEVAERAFEGCSNLTVYGYTGSSAEMAAEYAGCKFESLGSLAAGPQVSANVTELIKDDSVEFTIIAPEAEKLRMMTNGYTREIEVQGDTTIYQEDFHSSGTYVVTFSALINGVWTLQSEAVTITVSDYGTLAAPVLTAKESIKTDEVLEISWDTVADAEGYVISIDTEDGEINGFYTQTKSNSVSVRENTLRAGKYVIRVIAQADGWNDSETTKTLMVEQGEEYSYSVLDDGTICITGYMAAETTIEIPTEIDGYQVSSITSYAFRNSDVQSISIPEGIALENYVFSGCESLTDVYLPKNTGEISSYAFENCDATLHVYRNTIAHTMTMAKGYNYELYDVPAEESGITVSVSDGPYYWMDRIMFTVTVPKGATKLRMYVDGKASYSDTEVTDSLTLTEYQTFYDDKTTTHYVQFSAYVDGVWTPLTEALALEVFYYGKLDTPVITMPQEVYAGEELEASWTAPEGAQRYQVYLYWINGEQKITLASAYPEENKVTFRANAIDRAGTIQLEVTAFADGWSGSNCAQATAQVKTKSDWLYSEFNTEVYLSSYLGTEENVIIPDTLAEKPVTVIDSSAFAYLGVKSVTISENVKKIGWRAFYACSELMKAIIPAGVTSIDDSAFTGCDQMTIYGYAGTEAERYAKEKEIPFAALEGGTQAPEFTLEPAEIRLEESAEIQINDTDADMIRVYLNGSEYTQQNVTDGSLSIKLWEYILNEIGTYEVCISGRINGVWSPISEAQTITVMAPGVLSAPEIEEIGTVLPRKEFIVRWKPVENAQEYELEIYAEGEEESLAVYRWSSDDVDEDGLCYREVYHDIIIERGHYTAVVTADAVGYEAASTDCRFEVDADSDWLYTVSEDGVTITGYVGNETNVLVPRQFEGKDVIAIGDSAFSGDSMLVSVVLPEGLTSIGNRAFVGCVALTKVVIPAGVISIADSAFSNCEQFTIHGYTRTEAERYAKEKEIPFIALTGGVQAPEFSLEPEEILIGHPVTVKIEDTNADMIRVYLDNCLIGQYSVEDGSISITLDGEHFKWIDRYEYEVCISARVNGVWSPMSEAKTVKICALSAPEIEPIGTVKPRTSFTIRWKAVENAEYYVLQVYEEGEEESLFDCRWHIYQLDNSKKEDGFYNVALTSSAIVEEGKYVVVVTATAAVYKATSAECRFEAVAGSEWEYTVAEDGITITKYNGRESVVSVPSQIEGKDVVALGDSAFRSDNTLVSVVLPEGLISIGEEAFENCGALKHVELPKSLTKIETSAFEKCTALKKITLPEGLTFINSYAFRSCDALVQVELPESLTSISVSMFENCTALKQITLPKSVTAIGDSAFENCVALEQITIPSVLKRIDNSAFENCFALEQITLSEHLWLLGTNAFKNCTALKQVILPTWGRMYYSSGIFTGCNELEIWGRIGSDVERYAQSYSIPFHAIGEDKVEKPSFTMNCDSICYNEEVVFYVTAEKAKSVHLYIDGRFVEKYSVKEGQVEIIYNEFDAVNRTYHISFAAAYENGDGSAQCESQTLEVIYYGALGVPQADIPSQAVRGTKLKLDWPDVENAQGYYVTGIDEMLTQSEAEVQLPSAGTSHTIQITAYARGWKEGVCQKSITLVNQYVYEIVDGYAIITDYLGVEKSVFVPSSFEGYPVKEIGDGAFEGNTAIKHVYLPDSVTTIGTRSFKNCTEMQSIVGECVTGIGEEAFSGCRNLTNVRFYKYIYYIGGNAFYGVTLPETSEPLRVYIEELPSGGSGSGGAYEGNHTIYEVVYAEGVKEIPRRTHYDNTKLNIVKLPLTLETIGSEAFARCGELSNVELYDQITLIADDAFSNSPKTHFVIHVKNMTDVSYVEQYALDHKIPYTKELYTTEVDKKAETGIEGIEKKDDRYVLHVDVPYYLVTEGDCTDTVKIYLDENCLGEYPFTSGKVKVLHTFTELGNVEFYSKSYNGTMLHDTSKAEIIRVIGTTFSMDKTEAWTCENVHFEIVSSDLTGTVSLYADGEWFADAELVDGKASVDYPFTKAGERKITVKTEQYTSVEKTITIKSIGKLDQPVVEAEEVQFYADGLNLAWNTVEHADGYKIYALSEAGETVYHQSVQADNSISMTHTIAAQDLPGIGNYAVYVMAYGYQYDQSQSDSVTVSLIDSDEIIFMMKPTSVKTGEDVTFTVTAVDGVKAKLIVDGDEIETHTMTDNRVTFVRPFHKSGEREVTFSVLRDGEWSDPADVQILTVESAGQLDAPVVTVAEKHLLGSDVPVSWNDVDHADGYSVYVTNSDGAEVFRKENITDTALTIPSQTFVSCTLYTITVMAYGTGYDQSKGTAQTQIIDRLPGPVITSPTEGQSLSAHEHLLAWEAVEGAQSYVVSLAKKTTDASGNAVYEKVWASPNEVINVGNVLSYPLSDLVYGGEYRVAVGAVLEGTGLDDATEVGWTEREFSVAVPALNVTVSAEPNPAYEKQMVTITATVDQAQSTAVLKDANGNVYTPDENKSEEGKFVFAVTESAHGEYTYTVTVSGTGELTNTVPVEKTITVTYLDANAPEVESVTVKPATIWPGTEVMFAIIANPNTEFIAVYLHNADGSKTYDGPYAYEDVLYPSGNRVFTYKHSYDAASTYTLHFTPVNADKEWSEGYPVTVNVLEKGKLPNPELENLANGDVLINDGFVVEWKPLDLAEDMEFGGYCLLLEKKNADGSYALVPSYVYAHTDSTRYPLTGLEAGSEYRLHLYALEKGHAEPDGKLHGETIVDFGYRTIPEFDVASIETSGLILQPVTVKWNPPVWKDAPDLTPDRYVIWWYGPGLDGGYAMEASGDASSCVLPKDKLTQGGSFSVNVYAIMGENQRMSGGIDSFQIVPPTVTVDSADVKDFQIAEHDVHVKGSALGGVQAVSVELLENDVPVTLVDENKKLVGRLVLEVANQAFSCELDPDYVDPPARYSVRVRGYMDMVSAQAGTDYKCETVYAITTLNGEITSILLGNAEAIDKSRYAFTGNTQYQVYVNGFAESITVIVDGKTQTFGNERRMPMGNGRYRFDIALALEEGIHSISFKTDSGVATKRTYVASIKKVTESIMYAGSDGAQLKAWPTDSYKTAKILPPNGMVRLRGMCGEYAYVRVSNVDYFVRADGLVDQVDASEYRIISPKNGTVINMKDKESFVVSWDACAQADYFIVTLTDDATGRVLCEKNVLAQKSDAKEVADMNQVLIDMIGIHGPQMIPYEQTQFTKNDFDAEFDWSKIYNVSINVIPYAE